MCTGSMWLDMTIALLVLWTVRWLLGWKNPDEGDKK